MKKLTLVICVLFLFTSCEKKQDSVVDVQTTNYQFNQPTVPAEVNFSVNPVIIPTIKVTNLPSGAQVWFDVSSLYSDNLLVSKVLMLDDGQTQTSGDATANDNVFTGKFAFASSAYTGYYELSFYITTIEPGGDEVDTKIAFSTLSFTGIQQNLPPIISDLSMPSSVNVLTDFMITLKVADINSDVDQVYYTLTNPNGLVYSNYIQYNFFLFDDGSSKIIDTSHGKTSGDVTAGDGIYSRKLSFDSTATNPAVKGAWSFTFRAIDKNGSTSNSITQKLILK